MPSSGYVADTFVAGEQPTTAKWNELWGNDASFNSGAGFNDAILATRHFGTNSVPGSALATDAITLGFAQSTSNFTGSATTADQDITGLSVTVTVPAGGRRVRISGFIYNVFSSSAAGSNVEVKIKEGATVLADALATMPGVNYGLQLNPQYVSTPSAGSHTYKLAVANAGAGAPTVASSATAPSFILVELI